MKFFRGLRSRWSRSFNSMSETLSEDYVGERAPKGLRYSLFTALLLLLLVILLGWYWSDEPDLFKVTSINNQAEQAIVGTATTGTLVYVVDKIGRAHV